MLYVGDFASTLKNNARGHLGTLGPVPRIPGTCNVLCDVILLKC